MPAQRHSGTSKEKQRKLGDKISTRLSNRVSTPPAKKQKTEKQKAEIEQEKKTASTVTVPSWHRSDGFQNKEEVAVLQPAAESTQESKEEKNPNGRPSWHNYDASEAVERIWPSRNKGKGREVVALEDIAEEDETEDTEETLTSWDEFLLESLKDMEEELECWFRDPGIVGWNGRKVGESSKMGEMRGRKDA